MNEMAGTGLDGTEEVRAWYLRSEAKQQATVALAGLAPPLATRVQSRTYHGGVGNKTPEQWMWWGIKANWPLN
jgi:hypothetical protein